LSMAFGGALSLFGLSGAGARTRGGRDATCRCSKLGTKQNPDLFCQSERCRTDDQCCSGKCVNVPNPPNPDIQLSCVGEKVCLCRFSGARCSKGCACCSGRCRSGRCA